MSEHSFTEKMHDLLDGLLPAAEEAELRKHVEGCAPCREELARLEEVVTAVRGLPMSARAPEGIWASIQARVGDTPPGAGDDARVLEFRGGAGRRRRFHVTLPQLAAAAVLVSVLSAGSMWMAISGLDSRSTPAVVAGELRSPAARAASLGDAGYAEAVGELEAIVEQGRDLLAPETVAAIDSSLRTIDEALAEVEAALQADPSSAVLGRMLVNHQRSRLRLLRQAAVAVRARS
jgi:anti-sigma factor RsiW